MVSWQTTLCRPFTVSGVGIHTGQQSTVMVGPAPPGHGIQFKIGAVRIPARADFVVNTRRCTRLGAEGAEVSTVEHLLASLVGMGVDNALVEVEGPEIPVLDGSAQPWVEKIASVGLEITADRSLTVSPVKPVALSFQDAWYVATPADRMSVVCVTDFDHPMLGTQAVEWDGTAAAFGSEVAPARTFGFRHEVDALIASGLALGGSLDNALIVEPEGFSSPLRLPLECAAHKLLDVVGDLALSGGRVRAAITAIRPNHQANVQFAALLRAA